MSLLESIFGRKESRDQGVENGEPRPQAGPLTGLQVADRLTGDSFVNQDEFRTSTPAVRVQKAEESAQTTISVESLDDNEKHEANIPISVNPESNQESRSAAWRLGRRVRQFFIDNGRLELLEKILAPGKSFDSIREWVKQKLSSAADKLATGWEDVADDVAASFSKSGPSITPINLEEGNPEQDNQEVDPEIIQDAAFVYSEMNEVSDNLDIFINNLKLKTNTEVNQEKLDVITKQLQQQVSDYSSLLYSTLDLQSLDELTDFSEQIRKVGEFSINRFITEANKIKERIVELLTELNESLPNDEEIKNLLNWLLGNNPFYLPNYDSNISPNDEAHVAGSTTSTTSPPFVNAFEDDNPFGSPSLGVEESASVNPAEPELPTSVESPLPLSEVEGDKEQFKQEMQRAEAILSDVADILFPDGADDRSNTELTMKWRISDHKLMELQIKFSKVDGSGNTEYPRKIADYLAQLKEIVASIEELKAQVQQNKESIIEDRIPNFFEKQIVECLLDFDEQYPVVRAAFKNRLQELQAELQTADESKKRELDDQIRQIKTILGRLAWQRGWITRNIRDYHLASGKYKSGAEITIQDIADSRATAEEKSECLSVINMVMGKFEDTRRRMSEFGLSSDAVDAGVDEVDASGNIYQAERALVLYESPEVAIIAIEQTVGDTCAEEGQVNLREILKKGSEFFRQTRRVFLKRRGRVIATLAVVATMAIGGSLLASRSSAESSVGASSGSAATPTVSELGNVEEGDVVSNALTSDLTFNPLNTDNMPEVSSAVAVSEDDAAETESSAESTIEPVDYTSIDLRPASSAEMNDNVEVGPVISPESTPAELWENGRSVAAKFIEEIESQNTIDSDRVKRFIEVVRNNPSTVSNLVQYLQAIPGSAYLTDGEILNSLNNFVTDVEISDSMRALIEQMAYGVLNKDAQGNNVPFTWSDINRARQALGLPVSNVAN